MTMTASGVNEFSARCSGRSRAEEALPYFYSLHSVTVVEDSLAQMDPNIKRRRTLEAIKRVLLRESLNQPLI